MFLFRRGVAAHVPALPAAALPQRRAAGHTAEPPGRAARRRVAAQPAAGARACPKLNAGPPAAVVWVAQMPWKACTTSCSSWPPLPCLTRHCCEPPFITRLLTYWVQPSRGQEGCAIVQHTPCRHRHCPGWICEVSGTKICCVCRFWTYSARRSVAMAAAAAAAGAAGGGNAAQTRRARTRRSPASARPRLRGWMRSLASTGVRCS